jgi:rhamnosyltransferase
MTYDSKPDTLPADTPPSCDPKVSIVVLTHNGGPVCRETVAALLLQEARFCFEVIVVDTASSDGTPEAIQRLFGEPATNPQGIPLRLYHITKAEFGHGRTRNFGGGVAKGSILVFLSQDATPVGNGWLETLTAAFADECTYGAFCRQVARREASLPERFILESTYPAASSMRDRDSLKNFNAGYILFSNAASAMRRDALLKYPFAEDLMMCEDQHWAVSVLSAGYKVAYVAGAQVAHSHLYSLRSLFSRNFDYAVSLRTAPANFGPASYLGYLKREVRWVLRRGGLKATPWMAAFEAARIAGFVLGSRHSVLPLWLCQRLSGYPSWFQRKCSLSAR